MQKNVSEITSFCAYWGTKP